MKLDRVVNVDLPEPLAPAMTVSRGRVTEDSWEFVAGFAADRAS
jgi:hypothetical protein